MASLGAPVSVEDIVEQAKNFEYNALIPLRYWLRSADAMQKEAQVYEQEGNDPQTYLLLYRHAILVLEKLSKHPQAKEEATRKALRAAQKIVQSDLNRLDQLKPRIRKRHAEYLERKKKQREALRALEGRGDISSTLSEKLEGLSVSNRERDQRNSYEKTTLDAGKNRSLAAQLAQREMRRRDAVRRNIRQSGVSEEEEHERRKGSLWGDWDKDLNQTPDDGDDDLSRQIQQVGQQREAMRHQNYQSDLSRPTPVQSQSLSYQYPSVPHKSRQQDLWSMASSYGSTKDQIPARPPKEPFRRLQDSLPPMVPPKPPNPSKHIAEPAQLPPPIPSKYSEPPPPIPSKYSEPSPSAPTPDIDPNEFTFKPSAYLENGTPLRTVFLPPGLRQEFLACAQANTSRNLETCGILCGILKSNALFISRLVIPEQKSTSDTCETLNEEGLFEYCDKEELMVLGWIHTHPTQTCFMSSRDLHTHCGYQVMMPESIAIVCAPSKTPSWGCFRLTDPPGMKTVLHCTQPGLFHPHSVDNIYTDALKPGHVHDLPGMPFDVVDLRP
ncbi:hypothetical protein GQ43DRAFT_442868 [Delitschia confertaspora ATCC 74209]|uniref:MPN domain-containing protein n=1 Tax=Delitschia confertaspora ATCC 74209 TaxID=1513339 RepID=A0A9P4MN28_9PLEO|nr:hypothetical protein GQ43DRAFT_442868 [Delitschia confertaspora ATCC 74209]